jgi:hypothetical protein
MGSVEARAIDRRLKRKRRLVVVKWVWIDSFMAEMD